MGTQLLYLFMEVFEEEGINWQFRSETKVLAVEDTFILWQHGDKLQQFFEHNSLHEVFKITKVKEENEHLPFLNVMVKETEEDTLQRYIRDLTSNWCRSRK